MPSTLWETARNVEKTLMAFLKRGVVLSILDRLPQSKALREAVQQLDRRPGEKKLFGTALYRHSRTVFFLSLLGVGAALFVPPFWSETVHKWLKPSSMVQFPLNGWKVLYPPSSIESEHCADLATSNSCPAATNNASLWASAEPQSSTEHREWVRAHPGARFWIGQKVSSDVLKKASEIRANQIILGYFLGTARIWIDGNLAYEQHELPLEPTVLSIAYSRLALAQDLSIAIELLPATNIAYPDYLNKSEGGEGFATTSFVDDYKGYENFVSRVRPAGLWIGNLIIALLFLFFWRNIPIKQEYFFLACFALSESVYQFRHLDWVRQPLTGSGTTYRFQFFLSFLNGILALCLGLSFARVTNQVIHTIWIACTIVFFALTAFYSDPVSLLELSGTLTSYWVPTLALVGACICILQAYSLNQDTLKRDYLSLRIERLILFAGALIFLALLQRVDGSGVASNSRTVIFYKFGYFFAVVTLAAIVIRDYRESEQFRQELLPLAEHVELAKRGEPVYGAVVYFDLKKSEPIIRAGERKGDTAYYLRRIMQRLCDHIVVHGGLRFTLDGDMVKALFPDRKGSGTLNAIQAIAGMESWLTVETAFLVAEGVLAQGQQLAFRCGLSIGLVRASMNDTGAIFEHADHTTPLLDAARMLKIEEEHYKNEPDKTLIVMTAEARDILQSDANGKHGVWRTLDLEAEGKHGQKYSTAVLEPIARNSPGSLKKAG